MDFKIPNMKVELIIEEYHNSAVEIGNGVFLSFVEGFNKIQLINGFNPKDISASAVNEIMQNTELALNQIIDNPNGNPYNFIYD